MLLLYCVLWPPVLHSLEDSLYVPINSKQNLYTAGRILEETLQYILWAVTSWHMDITSYILSMRLDVVIPLLLTSPLILDNYF